MSNAVEITEAYLRAFQLNTDTFCDNSDALSKISSDEELSKFLENDQIMISDYFIGCDYKDLINENIPLEKYIRKIMNYFPSNIKWNLKYLYFSFKLKRNDPNFSWKEFLSSFMNFELNDIVKDADSSGRTSFHTRTLITVYDESEERYSMFYITNVLDDTNASDDYTYINIMIDTVMCKDILPDNDSNHLTDIMAQLTMYHNNAINIYHKYIHKYLNDTNEYINMIL